MECRSPTLQEDSHGDFDRRNTGGSVAALVAADEVEGQRRVVAGHLVTDFAVGNQTKLDERLEAVADAEHRDRRACSAARGCYP